MFASIEGEEINLGTGMDIIGWSVVILIAAGACAAAGYWFGYQCGHDDAASGVEVP